jgi:hypothetical protein
MTETDLSDWLPIEEAAKVIGCSTRTVERVARLPNRLEQRLRPQAGSPPVAVFSPESVAEEAARRRPASAPFVLPHVPAGNGNGKALSALSGVSIETQALAQLPAGDDPIRQLFAAALRAVLSPPSPPVSATVSERPVLTLDEAVHASGWSRTYLLRQIRNGTLKAEKDRGWKIRRKDLEAL